MLDAIATIVTEEQPQWKGTASELLILLPQLEIAPNILTRKAEHQCRASASGAWYPL